MRIILTILLFFACFCKAQELNLRQAADRCRHNGETTEAYLRSAPNSSGILELRTVFSTASSSRAVWDIPINLNLMQTAGLRMEVCCRNPGVVSQFNVYIKTGNTWQSAQFEVSANEQWESVFIPKASFAPESGISSWNNCTTLRIAAWKGGVGQLQLYFSSLEFVRQNAGVALIRGSCSHTNNSKALPEALRHARNLSSALVMAGLYPAVIEECDMSFTILRPYRFLLVPSIDSISPEQRDTIMQFMRAGGKVGLFYSLPPPLAAELGVPVGKYTNASSVQGALGQIVPDEKLFSGCKPVRQLSGCFIALEKLPSTCTVAAWWGNCTGQVTRWPAVVKTSRGFWMTHVYMNQDPLNGGRLFTELIGSYMPEAQQSASATLINCTARDIMLSSSRDKGGAQKVLEEAKHCHQQRQYGAAATACYKSLEQLKKTSVTVAAANPNELRALWCRYPGGLPGLGWQRTLESIHASGFNAIFPISACPYFTTYESRMISRVQGEGLPECIAAASRTGIRVHAWVNCLGIEDAPESVIHAFAREGRLQLSSKGTQLAWLCPNNQDNLQLLSRMASELVSKNVVEGIHLDRIRYPGRDSCYCEHCRQAFAQTLGFSPAPWPGVVMGGEYQQRWQEFRKASINRVLATISQAALSARRNIFLSAAVYPDWEQAQVTVGQDWGTWCKRRWVSFVCPMSYHGSTSQFTSTLNRQLAQIQAPNMLVPGIGTGPMRMSVDELARQINATRTAKTYGFILFDLGQREAFELLPALISN